MLVTGWEKPSVRFGVALSNRHSDSAAAISRAFGSMILKVALSLLLVVALVLASGGNSHAQTVVLENNIAFGLHPTFTGWYAIRVWLTPHRNDNHDWNALLRYEDMIMRGFNPTSDSIRMFLVHSGDVLSWDSISAGKFPSAIFEPSPHHVGNEDFYLGFSGAHAAAGMFGWARLGQRDGVLSMIDNAMAYHVSGIVVGATRPIPEPATMVLVICGTASLSRCRRRN
jgi:hypothetical protein